MGTVSISATKWAKSRRTRRINQAAADVNVVESSPSHQPQHRTAFQHQISETSFLDGVTFTLNSKFAPNQSSSKFDFPQPKFKSAEDIENEFSYVFTNEYELIES